MCYRRRAKFLVQGHISSLGAQGDFHGLGQCINAFFQRTTRIFSKNDLFSHNQYSSASILKFISLALLLILLNSRKSRASVYLPYASMHRKGAMSQGRMEYRASI